jgi:CRP-like cAMP-binding protein
LKGAVEYPVKLEPGTDQSGFMKAKCIEKTTGAVFGDFRQDSHFAVFPKKEYDKIATFYKIKIMQDQIAFLLSLPIFQGWQPHHMKQWLDIFEKKTYKRKAVIYKQNDPSTHIYIIKSGSVLCNKVIPIKANLLGGHEVGVDEENQVFLVDNRLLCRTVEVAVLGHGQVLGDEEALDMYSIAKSRENRNQEKKPLAKRSKNANALDHKKEEILDFDHISIKRETSMSISTPEAEIWSVSIRVSSNI